MSEVNDNETRDEAPATDAEDTAAPRGDGSVLVTAGPETRSERWVKYGLNVGLTSLMVIILAFIVVWAAQRYRARGDLTAAGAYSLKPQTVTVINETKAPVKIVSLYPRLKQEPGTPPEQQQQDFYQAVDDILQEYKRKGKNIDVDAIDPVAEPAKLDLWLGEVMRKYGGNVGAYKELLTQFPDTLKKINELASAEVQKMTKLPEMQFKDERQAEALYAAFNTVRGFPTLLEVINQDVQNELQQKIPDYKGRVRNVEGSLNTFSLQADAVRRRMEELQNNADAPEAARNYAKESQASFDAMKKLADDVLAKIKGLGELKLDEVRQRLVAPEGETPPPAIAVMGENDIKLIDFKDVWKSGESTGMLQSTTGTAPKYRFAGEQQLTAAILSLSQPQKTKVAFIRAGGPPKITGGGNPMMGGGGDGPFSEIANRLRSYNFEVLEKDVSGQSMQQAMMGRMPPPNEPSDEEIKDAIWVVFSEPQMSQFGPMPGGPELGNKLKEHLDRGGSAMVLFDLQGDDLSAALKDWGVSVRPNVVAVHEPVVVAGGAADDFIEQARRQPPIFVINEYGGPHPITSTLQALDAALVPMIPVQAPGAEGAEVTRVIPVPQEPQSWGEGDIQSVTRRGARPTFDPNSGDVAGPLYAGAAVQKKDKGRLVVIGCAAFANNFLIALPDQKVYDRTGRDVARFPGNGELFTNSVFWLAKMEKMIALSPSALDTPRIEPMSKGMLAFWRVGVLLVGLPLLALASGLLVWHARKD
jgi:hypothetical protein